MSLRVTLVGPASPQDLVSVLDEGDAARAEKFIGYRGVSVSELAKALVGAGCQVSVVTGAHGRSSIESFNGPSFELVVVPFRSRARHRAMDLYRVERHALTQAVNSIESDVVHAHWTYEFALAALAVKDRPILVTAHDAPFTVLRHQRDAYRAMRFLVAWWARSRTRNLTVVSPYLAGAWRRQMLYRGSIAITPDVIPVPSDRESSPSLTRTRVAASVLCVADAGKLKNVPALLRAFALVLAREPSAKLTLVGQGLEQDGVMAKDNSKYSRAVTWSGLVDRATLYSLYCEATVLMHPSKEETFGLTIAEAMSLGLPVVAGATSGAVPWLLDDGKSGCLVDVGSPEAIAAGILAVIQDPALSRRYVAAAYLRLKSEFSSDRVVGTYLREYERIVKSGARYAQGA